MKNEQKLTMTQALVRWMQAQSIRQIDGSDASAFAGVWAIFGHGNVAGLGEALYQVRDQLPTWRGHNEQSMAHAAIAYAKQMNRRRMMAVTSSIGPGASNMVTAAALAHVNRLPVLLLPGDVFADRRPDPVLQQIEAFGDGTISVNDCFKPVSRYFDRIMRPEQLLQALPKALSVLTDPANSGPVTLALCQDVQAEAYHWPIDFFTPKTWHIRRPAPDALELQQAVTLIAKAKRPIIIAGGGVRYSGAHAALQDFAEAMKIPVAVTQAGKSTILDHHPLAIGAIGVTGSSAANHLAEQADLVLAVGTRLQDFTSGSNGLFKGALLTLNVQLHDASKHRATPLVCDAKAGLLALIQACGASRLGDDYLQECDALKSQWRKAQAQAVAAPSGNSLPSDGQVIGAVARNTPDHAIIIGAAGSMPGELHKLWDANSQDCYHMEYGFSCMGYELAAAIGVGLACPDRPGIVFVGDGSYLMMNSELITAVLMGIRVTVIVTDNHGFGCIHRLQAGTGGAAFNNLFIDCKPAQIPQIDFVQHARSMGARAHRASSIADLERMVAECVEAPSVDVIVIETNPEDSTEAGGSWWDVAIPEVSPRPSVERASAAWRKARTSQHKGYR